ncbi:MAG: DNA polymerase ligase N-terminal domain-containing protein [Elusimicrobiota bacterium]
MFSWLLKKKKYPLNELGKYMYRFTVQKHSSKTLHYDFRLQVGLVLKSWAVPHGPSLDPTEKRLAVEVDDHPLDYADFEGTIPEGQHGAGEVIVWDRGSYTLNSSRPFADQYENGDIEFELHGEKLKGTFRLLKMKWQGKHPKWLLIKKHDGHISGKDILSERPESVISLKRLDK